MLSLTRCHSCGNLALWTLKSCSMPSTEHLQISPSWTRYERAAPFIPTGPAFGSPVEYDDLRRTWAELLPGLPTINGWTITEDLPDVDDIGRAHLEYAEIGEQPWSLWEDTERPRKELAEYRFRSNRARRKAVRGRLDALVNEVSLLIGAITLGSVSGVRGRVSSGAAVLMLPGSGVLDGLEDSAGSAWGPAATAAAQALRTDMVTRAG
jgi:hypothetical protein